VYTPLDSLQMTSAHEFHHAIQFGYNVFFDVWYGEATSTWYEGELYPLIRQNYNYVQPWFASSTRRLDLAVDANALSTGAGYLIVTIQLALFLFLGELYPHLAVDYCFILQPIALLLSILAVIAFRRIRINRRKRTMAAKSPDRGGYYRGKEFLDKSGTLSIFLDKDPLRFDLYASRLESRAKACLLQQKDVQWQRNWDFDVEGTWVTLYSDLGGVALGAGEMSDDEFLRKLADTIAKK